MLLFFWGGVCDYIRGYLVLNVSLPIHAMVDVFIRIYVGITIHELAGAASRFPFTRWTKYQFPMDPKGKRRRNRRFDVRTS